MKSLTFLISTCASILVANADTNKTQVYLFAGQSNMDGRADAANLSAEDLERLDAVKDRIQFAYNWKDTTPLQETTPAGHIKKKYNLEQCYGPELFFGITLAEAHPEQKFIFIKRAQGGTSLYGCWNPNWTAEKAAQMNEAKQPKLYHDFIKFADSVLSEQAPDSYEVKAMFWVQGESDSGVKKWGPEPAKTYGENLQNLISSTRKHFQNTQLPFLLLEVGGGEVIKGMQATADADPQVSFIAQSQDKQSPFYLPKNPPPIGHYNTEGMKRIGINFYNEYQSKYAN